MQWYTVGTGASHHGAAGGLSVSQFLVAAGHIGPLRDSDHDAQERHSHHHIDLVEHLCGPANPAKPPAQRGRHPLFYSGVAFDGADPLLSEEKRRESKSQRVTGMDYELSSGYVIPT